MKLETRHWGHGSRRIGLVHGLGGDSATWEPFVERILRNGDATVIAPDLRGHGRSARSNTYSVAAFADDLVETLPSGLEVIVGHSLGGPVVAAAVGRLAPASAVYLDPGFKLPLPTSGLGSRLFWSVAPLALGVAALGAARQNAKAQSNYPESTRRLIEQAKARADRTMAVRVFRDVAFHPTPIEPPVVPSTLVLSAQSRSVLPEALAEELAGLGWSVRRLPHLHHDMQLEDPDATFAAVRDVLFPAP